MLFNTHNPSALCSRYYRKSPGHPNADEGVGRGGFLASIALIIYAILSLTVFKLFVTMSLAGIAGFLLSIGMAGPGYVCARNIFIRRQI